MFFNVVLLWSSFALVFVLGKELLYYFNFLDFIALRFLIAGPLLLVYKLLQKRRGAYLAHSKPGLGLRVYVLFFAIATLQFFLPFTLEYWAQCSLSAGKVALIYSFSPFVTAILSLFIRKEALCFGKIMGLLLGLCGASFVFLPQLNFWTAGVGLHFVITLPDVAIILAMISSCFAWILTGKLLHCGFSSSLINGIAMIIGGVMTVICRIAFSKFSLLLFLQIPKVQWLWFFVIVGLSNFVGYPLYTKLLGTYTPTFMSLSGFLCPVITATLGYLVLGEQILFKSLLLSLIFGSLGLLVYSSGHFTVFKKKASRQ